jgi:hypothetical protein
MLLGLAALVVLVHGLGLVAAGEDRLRNRGGRKEGDDGRLRKLHNGIRRRVLGFVANEDRANAVDDRTKVAE